MLIMKNKNVVSFLQILTKEKVSKYEQDNSQSKEKKEAKVISFYTGKVIEQKRPPLTPSEVLLLEKFQLKIPCKLTGILVDVVVK